MICALSRPIALVKSSFKNDCGPCSVASVLSFFLESPPTSREIAREMGPWRLPWLEATTTWGVTRSLRRYGIETSGGFLGTVEEIKRQIDLDRPVVVMVRPTDVAGLPAFSLHYRVVVGYNDSAATGDGEFYFNCSAAPFDPSPSHPGNVAVNYGLFRRQWLTYLSINWYAVAYPREA